MKKTTYLLILALIFSTCIHSQSTERFIRIIGNAKQEIKANKAKVYFTISEIKKNKFRKTEEQEYDEVYNAVIAEFKKSGLNEKNIKKSIENLSKNRYSNSNEFFIEVNNNDLEKFTDISHPGFKIKKIRYVYDKTDKSLESELSLQAIADAKRKAKAICQEIDMEVGKILNIEVKEGDFSSNYKESKDERSLITYKVTITFKLID